MTTVIGSVSATTMPPAGNVKNYTSNLLNYNFVFIHVIYLLITNIRAGTSVGVTTNAMPTTSGTKYVLKQFFVNLFIIYATGGMTVPTIMPTTAASTNAMTTPVSSEQLSWKILIF